MITPTQLAQVGEAILLDPRVAALRSRFPELHFSECSEDDVSPRYRAAFGVLGYALFYITGATGHCLELTNDPEIATGLLVAALGDDD